MLVRQLSSRCIVAVHRRLLLITLAVFFMFTDQQTIFCFISLQWRHDERDGVSNNQTHHCLLNCLFKAQIKENIKAPRHWPLCGQFTGDRWISRTKGQYRGKCFHLMTSSCIVQLWRMIFVILELTLNKVKNNSSKNMGHNFSPVDL